MKPKRTILLIDDNEVERSCTRCLLETRGYLVVGARGSETLDTFWKGKIDLAVIKAEPSEPDSLDGYRLTEGIKRLSPETPVILFSTKYRYGDRGMQDHVADWFLFKGYKALDLLEQIRLGLIRKRGPKKKPVGVVDQVQEERVTA